MHVVFLLLILQAPIRETMERGVLLLQSGETERARELFEAVVELEPSHGPARLQLGQIAVARGEWETARRHLDVAVDARIPPRRLFLAWHLLGRARRALGDDVLATEAFSHAVELAPNFLPARLSLAELALSRGDLWTALAQYRASLAMGGARADVLALLADTARRMGALDLARCAIDAAIGRTPDDEARGGLVYLRAVIEEQEGRADDAIASVEEALALGYENAAPYLTLGNLYHEKMRLGDAIAAFEKGLTLDPEAAESIASFALSTLTTEEYGRLRSLLERHAAGHPESLNTLYGLGAMYLREGELERAATIFERLAEHAPERAQVQYNLAMTYLRLGREDSGRTAMARFRELKAREDAEWNRRNERIRLRHRMRELLANGGEDEEALAIALELMKAGNPEPEDALATGRLLHRLGRNPEARLILDRALELSPYDPEILEARLAVAVAQSEAGNAELLRKRLALLSAECLP